MVTVDPFLGPSREYFILVYAREIVYRAECCLQALVKYRRARVTFEGGQPGMQAQEVFTPVTEAIVHAMAIDRMFEASSAWKKKWAESRAQALKNEWPELHDVPSGLKRIRNSFEHYEERLDQWVYTSASHNYADFNIGECVFGLNTRDNFRSLIGSELYFWGQCVDLDEVEAWIRKIYEQVSQMVNTRLEPSDC